jgi:hypothetical protein
MFQFTAIQPYTVLPAAINNNAAFYAEVDPVHDAAANRTFDVGNTVITVIYRIDAVQLASVDDKDICHCSFQQRFQFVGVKEKSQTLVAALDKETTVNVQVDGFEGNIAARTDPLGFCFVGCVVVDPGKVDVIAAAAV